MLVRSVRPGKPREIPLDFTSDHQSATWPDREVLIQRIVAQYLPRDMAFLGLIEAGLSFAAIYAVMSFDGAPALSRGISTLWSRDEALFAGVLTLFASMTRLTAGLYHMDVRLDRWYIVTNVGLAAIIACVILPVVSGDQSIGIASMHTLFVAEILGVWFITLTLIRVFHGSAFGRAMLVRRILLVGNASHVEELTARLQTRRGSIFNAIVLRTGDIAWAPLRLRRVWSVVVMSETLGLDATALSTSLLDCKLRGMRVLSAADFHERYLGRINVETLEAGDLLLAPGFTTSLPYVALKRCSDIMLSLAMLILTLPLMAATALAIKIDDSGPVLYRQQRVGQFDQVFTLFKFRSMTVGAEIGGTPCWAQNNDPRVTRVGRFIRATRIDELPQLVNVIRGEMSLVGPRPERPHFVEQLAGALRFYRQRGYVKPGLTGWAQVNFPYGASIADAREKLAFDLYYVKNRSLLLDMAILFSTIRVVLFCKGAR